MVVHYLKTKNKDFSFSACGKALHITGGEAINDWDYVECKHCLKHQGEDAGVSND